MTIGLALLPVLPGLERDRGRSRPATRGLLAACLVLASGGPITSQAARFAELHRMLPADFGATRAVALGDVDGDGDPDALIGNEGQDGLQLNDGMGRFIDVTATHLPADADHAGAVALEDLDGDGDRDALIGNVSACGYSGPGRLYLNDGTGHLSDETASRWPTNPGDTTALAVADVDGDGDADVLIGSSSYCGADRRERLHLNDGTGHFTDGTSTHLPLDSSDTYALALADVDGDGDPDALIGNSGADRLYLNDGTGHFTDATAARLPADSDVTRSAVLADVDGDGDRDALTGNQGQDRLYLNDGTGRFIDATSTHLPADSDNTRALLLEDLDGDGDRDVLFGNFGRFGSFLVDPNRLCLNDGTGHFSDVTSARLPADRDKTTALALGDVDADGDRDVLVGNHWLGGGGQERLYLNDGSARFSDVTAPPLPADAEVTRALALADVDGDGDRDALLGNGFEQLDPFCCYPTDPRDRLYVNDGAGNFTDVTASSLGWGYGGDTTAVALADVDGDGDRDAMLVNSNDSNQLYLNDGAGKFTDVSWTALPDDYDDTRALALADTEGDGDLDAILGKTSHYNPNRVYVNDGRGRFTDASGLPSSFEDTRAVEVADVDGDGDIDALFGNYDGGFWGEQERLYLNDGAGHFGDVTATHLPQDSSYTNAAVLEDVDSDGDPDALIGNGSGGQDRLYRNDGAGRFVDVTVTRLPADAVSTTAVGLADMDGDGDRDAVLGILGQNRIYLNDGAGSFTDATTALFPMLSDATLCLGLADLDGDDDRDVLLGGKGQKRLLTNLGRQLAWRRVPRVGGRLVLDLHGGPGEAWMLTLSTGIGFTPSGGRRHLGRVLGPAGLSPVLATGVLDADGFDSARFLVPDDPALIGMTLLWHARIGSLEPFPIGRPCPDCLHEVTTLTDL